MNFSYNNRAKLIIAKRIAAFLYINIIMCANVFAQNLTREQYIEKYKGTAIRQMNQYGIPASIILAQGCLESGNGNSRLAVKANNHFGIKCHNWTGKRIYHDDDKRGECFRKYNSADDSFKDHSEFLRNGKRYQSLFDLKRTDYKAWAHGLKAAGYATNPKYATLLIDIIEKYSLYKYDSNISSYKEARMAGEQKAAIEKQNRKAEKAAKRAERKAARKAKRTNGVVVPVVIGENAGNGIKLPDENPATANASTAVPLQNSPLYRYSLDRQIFSCNGVPYIIATGNETYSSIAKEYNLFKRELLNFNDLRQEHPIEAGTIVYIKKKKKKGENAAYVVQDGETMYSISQKLGIRLMSLYELNNMSYGTEAEQGKILNLQ